MSFIQLPIQIYPNSGFGSRALEGASGSTDNVAIGTNTLRLLNSSGISNVAIGSYAGESLTFEDFNATIGVESMRYTRGAQNSTLGYQALKGLTGLPSPFNTAVGTYALGDTDQIQECVAVGHSALKTTSFTFGNVAVGNAAGLSVARSSYNTLIGYNAGYSHSLPAAASGLNTFVGANAGYNVTSGVKNTILGAYNGNQGGLDIRTLSNYVVLSDGDGNPRLYIDNTGLVNAPGGFAGVGGGVTLNNRTAAYTVIASDAGKAINCTANTFTVSLTAAATLGSGFACFVWNTGTGIITIDPNGAETIDGVATLTLQQGEGTQIVCDGTNWITGSKKTMRGYAENVSSSATRPSAGSSQSTAIGFNSGNGGSVTATGSGAIALGGSYASGNDSFAAAIQTNLTSYGATGGNAIALGSFCLSSGTYTVVIGANSSASGFDGVAIGDNCTASANGSAAMGVGAVSSITSKLAYTGTYFINVGDCQSGRFVFKRLTTGAVATVLTTNNGGASATNQIILPNNSAHAFSGLILARQQASGGTQSAAWRIEGLIRREAGAGTTTLVASTVTVISNVPAWTLTLSVDTLNGGLSINITGAAATNIRWTGTVDTSEVTYA